MKKSLYLSLPALAVAGGAVSCGKQPVQPNIIYLMFDDLGYGDLGCYGQEQIETPNIDARAENGLRFTDMYTACPLSAPSRCSRSPRAYVRYIRAVRPPRVCRYSTSRSCPW